jgi:hypothetical protein
VSAQSLSLQGHTSLASFTSANHAWQVFEDLRDPHGALTLSDGNQACVLRKRTEAVYAENDTPYFGMKLADIALAEADLLADHLLRHGEPQEDEVRRAAPPVASKLNPENYYGRLPWTTFVGTRQCADTMPVYTSGSTRTYHTDQIFADLHDPKRVARRREGLLGGWLPAVHKVIPIDEGSWYDVLVFADVDAADRFVVQTWHRTARIEHGRMVQVSYGHSYPSYPPRRMPPDASAFYAALLRFHDYWQAELADVCHAEVPADGWTDMVRHAFARELVVRPDGTYPKYGAVDRDYYGNEYDGSPHLHQLALCKPGMGPFRTGRRRAGRILHRLRAAGRHDQHARRGDRTIWTHALAAGALFPLHRRWHAAQQASRQNRSHGAALAGTARRQLAIACQQSRLRPDLRLERIGCLPVPQSHAMVEAVLRQQRHGRARAARYRAGVAGAHA